MKRAKLFFAMEVIALTKTDKLLEAIEYSEDSGVNWWESFSSKEEAFNIISVAIKEKPDEYQISGLLSYKEELYKDSFTEYENYQNILRILKKQIKARK
jgi:hypothetical protein